jgi:hypothetical protein
MEQRVNWGFGVKWLDQEHVLLNFTHNTGKQHDVMMTSVEYAYLMEMLQQFSVKFKDRIDTNVINFYKNNV